MLSGADSQLGNELRLSRPENIELLDYSKNKLDITDKEKLAQILQKEKPSVIINAAAYPNNKCDAHQDDAFAVNAEAVKSLAEIAKELNIRFIHISTDYVFSGESNKPYQTDDTPAPINAYGKSKLKGEKYIQAVNGDFVIIRTAWLYSKFKNNFVKTMLKLMQEKKELNVIADQVGTPTWAHHLALLIWDIISNDKLKGVYHFTDAGVASWYDFACAIQSIALELNIVEKKIPIKPVCSSDFSDSVDRPFYTVLNKKKTWTDTTCVPIHWQDALRHMLKEMRN